MELSIVTTLYESTPTLGEFYRRMKGAAEKLTPDYEIIFVIDGSPDDSLSHAVEIQKEDERVVVVDLSRNFGHHRALMTGLSLVRGRKVFMIDSDLEEDPELLHPFNESLERGGADVVFGIQASRKGRLFERLSGWVFYKVFNFLSSIPIPSNVVTVRLMTKRYVDSLLRHHETELFLPGLWQLAGYRQLPLAIEKHDKGRTSYNLARKVRLMTNAITSFSDKPLILIFYTGLLISFCALIYIIRLVTRALFYGIPVPGYASIVVSFWFLGGLTIFFIGVLGIYISKIFLETKGRPYVLIRDVYPPDRRPRPQ
ncbi:MAG: glycosyltransferase family 2 protein [Elusimicrobia bacterium]|nr:glycosyltransferase family 2 protein [Candidatus Obscuribacterium magneticum]